MAFNASHENTKDMMDDTIGYFSKFLAAWKSQWILSNGFYWKFHARVIIFKKRRVYSILIYPKSHPPFLMNALYS